MELVASGGKPEQARKTRSVFDLHECYTFGTLCAKILRNVFVTTTEVRESPSGGLS